VWSSFAWRCNDAVTLRGEEAKSLDSDERAKQLTRSGFTEAEHKMTEDLNGAAANRAKCDDGEKHANTAPRDARMRRLLSGLRLALAVGAVAAVAVAGLICWLGFQTYQAHQDQQKRELFLRVGRQGALYLTTINHADVDTDVQRILVCRPGLFVTTSGSAQSLSSTSLSRVHRNQKGLSPKPACSPWLVIRLGCWSLCP
jgi:ferric-dicitrate binding protein FerR (iron transport regulator)